MSKEYDIVVLGGGTGGYVAAVRASQLGMRVAVVEDQQLGGTCLHKGCIPSKSLLNSAEKLREMKNADAYGLTADNIGIDFQKVQNRKQKAVDTLYNGVKSLLKKEKIDVYNGYGRILGSSIFSPLPGTISVEYAEDKENTMLIPKFVLIATGSKPKMLPGLEFDGRHIIHSDHILELEELPSSIAIIGGGVIGIEWASLLIDFGVKVTVLEQADNILPAEDKLIQSEIKRRLSKRGVVFKTGITIDPDKIHIEKNTVNITLENNAPIVADKLLVSIGRSANTENIGLNNTDIQMSNGFIQTNEYYQTKESHIYAIGDCIGGMQLAHVASKEGVIAVEHMANAYTMPLKETEVPSCIYSYPEAARIGLTEKQANDAGFKTKVGQGFISSNWQGSC